MRIPTTPKWMETSTRLAREFQATSSSSILWITNTSRREPFCSKLIPPIIRLRTSEPKRISTMRRPPPPPPGSMFPSLRSTPRARFRPPRRTWPVPVPASRPPSSHFKQPKRSSRKLRRTTSKRKPTWSVTNNLSINRKFLNNNMTRPLLRQKRKRQRWTRPRRMPTPRNLR